ncbi:MAG: hypothetical protein AB1846_04400, partial [Chloroflexota bacterium]
RKAGVLHPGDAFSYVPARSSRGRDKLVAQFGGPLLHVFDLLLAYAYMTGSLAEHTIEGYES